jgi:tetratricopeptide (TPR) repeat protein
MTLEQALEAARQQHSAGRLAEAEAIYRQILAARPDYPDALHLMGVLAFQVGRIGDGLELIGRAIAIDPKIPPYYCNLGQVLFAAGRFDDAIAACRKALELRPDYAEALNNLGTALQAKGQLADALAAYRRATEIRPDFSEAHHNLGTALLQNRQPEEALACERVALMLRPAYPDAYNGLGNALKARGELDSAAAAYRQALALRSPYVEAENNLGNALREMGRLDEAAQQYRRTITLKPDLASAHFNLAATLLLQGNFEQGWPEHEWRWGVGELIGYEQKFTQPMWDGGDLSGRTILLHAEQGFGDTIQFVRYAQLVKQRSGRVILAVPTELRRLMQGIAGVDQLIAHRDQRPDFDVHCPLLSLPLVMKTRLETIPAPIPYLRADRQLSSRWRQRLSGDDSVKVGLAWAGRPTHVHDHLRSIATALLSPLVEVPNATFVSLQKGRTDASLPILDWTAELHDFADTAALIDNLDLVISVDSAMAHLAGAMGKPVWMLLQFIPDWRWLLDRSDSPWYPTMRIFRQPKRADWGGPLAQVIEELRILVSKAG